MVIHDRFGVIVTLVAGVGAVLGLACLLRPALLPPLRVYLRLTVVAVAVQVVVGLVLVATGHHPAQPLHWFYGAATLLALPLALWVGGSRPDREEPLWVAGGAVATALFALRAVTTG